MSYYAVLGVPEDADAEAIHNAYRARARQYHPDAGEGSSAGKFREIAEAYETLSDPMRRREYDRTLRPVPVATRIPMHEVVVEPLAQEWSFPSPRMMDRWATPSRMSRISAFDDWFEEVFRLLERDSFFDAW